MAERSVEKKKRDAPSKRPAYHKEFRCAFGHVLISGTDPAELKCVACPNIIKANHRHYFCGVSGCRDHDSNANRCTSCFDMDALVRNLSHNVLLPVVLLSHSLRGTRKEIPMTTCPCLQDKYLNEHRVCLRDECGAQLRIYLQPPNKSDFRRCARCHNTVDAETVVIKRTPQHKPHTTHHTPHTTHHSTHKSNVDT
jgi:hypothetical protein